tara:strand:+ start:996 stop:1292 length:297 start_codon:yes stop_codon:yes gene_type:complete
MTHFDELIKLKTYIKLNYDEDEMRDISNNLNKYILSMIELKNTEKKELIRLEIYLENEIQNAKSNYLKKELINENQNILKNIKKSDKDIVSYKNILNI